VANGEHGVDLGIGRSREDAVQSFLLDRLRVRWWVWLWSAFWRSRQLPCSHMAEEVVGQVTVTARAAVIPEAVSRIFSSGASEPEGWIGNDEWQSRNRRGLFGFIWY
jgi:hypothetical protein